MGRLDFQDIAPLGPDFEGAPYAAEGTDGLRLAGPGLTHGSFHLGNREYTAVSRFYFFNQINHRIQQLFTYAGHESSLTQHRLLH
ncbi:hypothetical protein D1872_319470 [compost metagenome]